MLDHKKQVAFHQANRYGVNDGAQDAQAGRLCDGFLAAALLLLGLDDGIGGCPLFVGVMDGAIGIRADGALCKVSDYAQRRKVIGRVRR
jgi:hypothetical protein